MLEYHHMIQSCGLSMVLFIRHAGMSSHDLVMWPLHRHMIQSWTSMLRFIICWNAITWSVMLPLQGILSSYSNTNQYLFYNSTGLHPHPQLTEVDPWYVAYIYDFTISLHLCLFRWKCLHSDESFYSSGSWLLALNPMPKTTSQPIVTKWGSQD